MHGNDRAARAERAGSAGACRTDIGAFGRIFARTFRDVKSAARGCSRDDLIDFNPQFNNERLIFTVGGGAGLLFGIFSILLCWHLTTSSLNLKKRKIGVLRALGAGDADVKRIVLFEALIVAICSFALALLLSLGVFYGSLQPLTYMAQFGVSMLNFTGWNVLILAALSFSVPLLSTLVPLKKFLKKPVVENITEK